MEGLTILNGTETRQLHELIEKYAFLDGFLTCDLTRYLTEAKKPDQRASILYLDLEGILKLKEGVLPLLTMEFPVILILPDTENTSDVRSYPVTATVQMPFSLHTFRFCNNRYIEERDMKARPLCFGELRIDRYRHEVFLDGKNLNIGGYEYEILLILLQNMGQVLSRESINSYFPNRNRRTTRNVDTHIKNIRRQIGDSHLIRCVRRVGYCIHTDDLYKEFGCRTRIL